MTKTNDREFSLKRKVADLQDKIGKLEIENAKLKKEIAKLSAGKDEEKPKKATVVNKKTCPDCQSDIKLTELPHGILELCSNACGYRQVRKK